MDMFLLILGCLQNFLGIDQLEADEVPLKDLLGGRVGVWEGIVGGENGGIDITLTRPALPQQKPVHATLSYQTIWDICNLSTILYSATLN
jgi:hypothetical protein